MDTDMTADTCPRCGATLIYTEEILRARHGVQCGACDDEDDIRREVVEEIKQVALDMGDTYEITEAQLDEIARRKP